ncbi:hypothetical protein BOH73_07295 [Pseudomonas versuta]|uniref:Uncharacterized protein n=1 Tax=Pseudomonas versuta TaxID=1788301 RepID=A0ABX3E9Z8_9PSED|nr:hypothetical protein AOC04_08915 [Pseudomonas versuta]OKA22232.1 hypothetical protein BOH73_07295 [Pseudomonas versuta]
MGLILILGGVYETRGITLSGLAIGFLQIKWLDVEGTDAGQQHIAHCYCVSLSISCLKSIQENG